MQKRPSAEQFFTRGHGERGEKSMKELDDITGAIIDSTVPRYYIGRIKK